MILADAGAGPWGSPATVSLLLMTWLLYELGQRRIRERPGMDRAISPRQVAAGRLSILVLWIAICSPLDAAADKALWVHMIQHLLIGLVAPLLWVHSRPLLIFSANFELRTRRRITHRIVAVQRSTHLTRADPAAGFAAMVIHVSVWWGWHLPVLFDAALRDPLIHGAEHLCLFWAGVFLWWACTNVRWNNRGGLAILYLFGAAIGTGMIGAFLTIDPNPIYATTFAGVHRWGLTRLSDQQLAGVIMWVAGGAIYLGAAAALALKWLSLGPDRHRTDQPDTHQAPAPLDEDFGKLAGPVGQGPDHLG